MEYKKEAYDMFVDLMSDLRKTLASYFFRAQFGAPRPQPRTPQRLSFSGPSDTPGGTLAEQAAAAGQRGQPGARRPAKQVDELGMSARAASGAAVPAGASGPDPAQLATNRGEAERKQTPVTVEDEPGRNDPCPCGSGKKYKKCHGRV
ncbi:MAG: hypothetical protein HKN72_05485 [Gemmatimonadetes bacterium]|nr:hypothetical protein [Gemmatimonadota bacterium]